MDLITADWLKSYQRQHFLFQNMIPLYSDKMGEKTNKLNWTEQT